MTYIGLLNAMDPGRHSESNQVCPLPVHSSIAEYWDREYSKGCNSQQVSEAIPENSNFLSNSFVNQRSIIANDLFQFQLNVLRHQLLSQEPDQVQSHNLPIPQSRNLTSGDEHESCTLGKISLELPQHSQEQQYETQQQKSCVVQRVDAAKLLDSDKMSPREVLLQYANFRRFPQNAESSQDTFLKDLHVRICNVQTCKCSKYRSLIVHYETCRMSTCVVCSPCRKLTYTDTDHNGSENSETDISRTLHKNKCNVNRSSIDEDIQAPLKRPRIQDEFVSENGPSNLANLLGDQPSRNEENSHSGKSSAGPHCNNEEPNCNQEKDESHFASVDDQAKCGGGVSRGIISDDQLVKTLEKKKLLSVSLTDCFTAEQIKEHIFSLNPSMHQVCAITFSALKWLDVTHSVKNFLSIFII